jgi:hypothetical protein
MTCIVDDLESFPLVHRSHRRVEPRGHRGDACTACRHVRTTMTGQHLWGCVLSSWLYHKLPQFTTVYDSLPCKIDHRGCVVVYCGSVIVANILWFIVVIGHNP